VSYGGSDLSTFFGSDYHSDYPDAPTRAQRRRHQQRRRRRRRGPTGALLVLLVIGGLVAGIVYGGRSVLTRLGTVPDYPGAGAGSVRVQVKQGDTASDIAATLAKAGVVKSERAFRDAAKEDPRSTSIQPGYYRLRRQMSGATALALMLDPASRLLSRVTVPEGRTAEQILTLLAEKTGRPLSALRAAAKDTAMLGLPAYAKGRLEGFLFPATYDFDPGTNPADMLRQMVATYRDKVDEAALTSGARALHLTPYEVIVAGSLVEEEAITPDFGKVARVIYNRVHRGQRLEMDSTVNYALGRNRVRVSAKDLEVNSPYNTYRRSGLPPTPISNPGLDAIEAALHPAAGNWLYFVKADKSGRSYFTADYQDFLRAKARAKAAGVY
jgi:UPF0755 protein